MAKRKATSKKGEAPEVLTRAEKTRRQWADPETRAKMIARMRAAKKA